MLHYYHGTKEELFNKVFDKKLQLLNNSFSNVFEKNMPFLDKVKLTIETHFDFFATNPELPLFILKEVMANPDRKTMFIELFTPKVKKILSLLGKEMEDEIKKGTIRNISPAKLLLNIGSINTTSILALTIMSDVSNYKSTKKENALLQKQKAENVEFILKGISP